MAKKSTSIKRAETAAKARELNKAAKSEISTETKKFKKAVADKNEPVASSLLSHVTSLLDRAAQDNVFHRNKSNRLKAQLAKQYATIKGA